VAFRIANAVILERLPRGFINLLIVSPHDYILLTVSHTNGYQSFFTFLIFNFGTREAWCDFQVAIFYKIPLLGIDF